MANEWVDVQKEATLALYAMTAGDGPRSYVRNSSYQRGVVDIAKQIIEREIGEKLDTKTETSFNIADFGCSTGHNSFPAMQFISQAIVRNTKRTVHICVFFNDVFSNDFNTLFNSLPTERLYSAFAAPGDLHGRLMPKSSLHFGYSSWSLHWLTAIPETVINKGRIIYAEDRKEVCDAYLGQYSRDIGSFLESRAVEMVDGGIMALLVPGVPEYWDPDTEYTMPSDLNLMGSCLVDMAKMGRLSEEKVDSFDLPFYFPTPRQLKEIVEKNQSFRIEKMEILDNPGKYTLPGVEGRVGFFRSVQEGMLTNHFGGGVVDELFERYAEKLAASPVFGNPENDKNIVILVVLQRKTD